MSTYSELVEMGCPELPSGCSYVVSFSRSFHDSIEIIDRDGNVLSEAEYFFYSPVWPIDEIEEETKANFVRAAQEAHRKAFEEATGPSWSSSLLRGVHTSP